MTRRCRLRAPDSADIPHTFSATRYSGFNDGMSWDPPVSEDELHAPLEQNLEARQANSAFAFTIEKKEDRTFVGRIVIRQTSTQDLWNIGYWTHPEHQRNGFMTEAAQTVIDFGFSVLGAKAIEARLAPWNQPSRRVLERIGMVEVEYIAQGFQKHGAWVPEFRMLIERRNLPEQARGATAAATMSAAGQPPPPSWPRLLLSLSQAMRLLHDVHIKWRRPS
jgi:ribosomal-protein-alanine N-acetyltransferase